MEPDKVVIVVPVYKASLNRSEEIALQQLQRVWGAYPKVFFAPVGLQFDYGSLMAGFRVERFPTEFFRSSSSYSRLMLSEAFYERFAAYEYLMLYQLDAFVFYDALPEFCAAGYDYIGAPVYRNAPVWHALGTQVGNGGFSLRRVSACLKLLRQWGDKWHTHPFQQAFFENEDAFWGYCGTREEYAFRVPDVATAGRFAVQDDVQHAFRRIRTGNLPMGGHAWPKADYALWQPVLASLGYELMDSRPQTLSVNFRNYYDGRYRQYHVFGLMRLYGLVRRQELAAAVGLVAKWLECYPADDVAWRGGFTEDVMLLYAMVQLQPVSVLRTALAALLLTLMQQYLLSMEQPEPYHLARAECVLAQSGLRHTAAYQALQHTVAAYRAAQWVQQAPQRPALPARTGGRIVAIVMVKNEQDVIESFVRHTLSFADVLLVCDHRSTDQTRDILQKLVAEGLPLVISTEYQAAHVQAEVMSALLRQAVETYQADFILPLDADEFLLPPTGMSCREALLALDTMQSYDLSWRRYVPVGGTEKDFLLARPLRRACQDDGLSKCIIGGALARQYRLCLMAGNHDAYWEDGTGCRHIVDKKPCPLSLAHFYWRSKRQFQTKILVGWLNIAAQFSLDTASGGGYRAYAERIAKGEELDWPEFVPESEPCDLRGCVPSQTMRYSGKAAIQVMANFLRAGEALAENFAALRVEVQQPTVTSVVPYLGVAAPFCQSLASVQQEIFPRQQIVVPVLAGALPGNLLRDMTSSGVQVLRTEDTQAGEQDVFAALARVVTGQFVEWVLPGETVAPDKLRVMVTSILLQQILFALYIAATKSAPHSAASPYMTLEAKTEENLVMARRQDIYSRLLAQGKVPDGGLSALLLRRSMLDACHWFRDGFSGGQPLLFAMYRELLLAKGQPPAAGILQAGYYNTLPEPGLPQQAQHQLVWYALLQRDAAMLQPGQRAAAYAQLRRNGITLLTQALEQGVDTQQPLWQQYQAMLQQL